MNQVAAACVAAIAGGAGAQQSVETPLTVDHVMASAALPLFFPAIRLGDSWYGDGGIRLSAPLSPALHLGAQRILAISTSHRKTFAEADQASSPGYPPPSPSP